MIASGMLTFRRCRALRLEGKSQVGIIYICVSSDGRIMTLLYHFFTTASVCLC
jgi:hypothetical protein